MSASEFEVQTLDGRTAAGSLVELSATGVVLETSEGKTAFELGVLAAVVGRDAPKADRSATKARVELVDHSQLAVSEYTVAADTAHVVLADKQRLEIPTRAIRWVRFIAPAGADEKQDKEWTDITEMSAGGDLLVTRKAETLDSLEGTVGNVDADRCQFEVDKETIAVKRAKIAGIVYFHPAAAELPESVGLVTAGDGSRLRTRTAALADGAVKVVTPAGVSLTVPLSDVTRMDFSSGKIAYLSDLEPENATFVPLVGLKEDLVALRDYYRFRRDTGFERTPLRTSGKTYRKGLALATRTVLSYKLPGKFRVFKAVVGIDDSVRPGGSLHLEIKADGKVVWQGEVRGSEPAQELEIDISGAKRLEIVADYGDDLDISDRLDLCEARVTK